MTYHHFHRGAESQIDHIMQVKEQTEIIDTIAVDGENPYNVSSHDAVIVETKTRLAKMPPKAPAESIQKTNWDKVDKDKYKEVTKEKLSCFIKTGGLELPAEIIVQRTNQILSSCAGECGPKQRKSITGKRKRTLKWDKVMKPQVRKIKDLTWEWKQMGKDKTSHLFLQIKQEKKTLRAMQRRKAATDRKQKQEKISMAHENDKDLFYKLIKQQRKSQYSGITTMDFEGNTLQTEGWANYFEKLANPKPNSDYDESFKNSRDLIFLLLKGQESNGPTEEPTTITQTANHIKSLKNGKAADLCGISAEHLKLASDEIATVITTITNMTLRDSKFPDSFRCGKIVPVLKKNKPAKDQNSYRRITINSIIGKITEKELVRRMKPILSKSQNPLQTGFTEKCSPSNGAVLITEAIAEATEQKKELYIVTLDARKAFDVVWQESALIAMSEQGITGRIWMAFVDMYDRVTSKVCINGQLSREIKETVGIRQGAESSTEVFKCRTNILLNELCQQPDGLHIGCINIAAPTCADDVCLLSASYVGTQTLINIAEADSHRQRYDFSDTKTKILKIEPNKTGKIEKPLFLNGSEIDYSQEETHLGIKRTDDGKPKATIEAKITTSRRAAYALMGAGLHGLNGISPEISTAMVNTYIKPILMSGLDALCLGEKDYELLESHHLKLLRSIQHLPTSTAKPALYLLSGSLPLEATHHQQVLSLYGRIIRRYNSIERELTLRQLAMKDINSNSWFSAVRIILIKYDLPSAIELLQDPPSKECWKKTYKEVIEKWWLKTLRQKADKMSSLSYLNKNACSVGTVHPVWKCGSDPLQSLMASTKAKLLVQRYPLTTSHTAGKNKSDLCPLCHNAPEDMEHFLIHCTALEHIRYSFKHLLENLASNLKLDNKGLVSAILDPSSFEKSVHMNIEGKLRRLCHRLHTERAKLLQQTR